MLPDVAGKLKTLGLEAILSSPEELASFQASEIRKWTKVIKESGREGRVRPMRSKRRWDR